MATASPVGELLQKLTCSLCVNSFKDPVTIPECGHRFCRGCLAHCWAKAKAKADASCPLCKQTVQPKNLQPSQQLANVVEVDTLKKKSIQGREGGETKKTFCEKHQEPLKFFCQTEQVPICVVGKTSKEHRDHMVVPIGEASQAYKDEMFRHLVATLKAKRDKIKKEVKNVRNESQEVLKITESERQKTEAEFKMLRQLMKEEEDRVLSQVDEVEKEIARRRDEHRARLSEELSTLESLIREMEGKQPETKLQELTSILKRCEKKEHLEKSVAFPLDLKSKIHGFSDIGPCLEGVRKKFEGCLLSIIPPMQRGHAPHLMQKANVTLDPTTASADVLISKDERTITCRCPSPPVRNILYDTVVGREEFSEGRYYWEANVGNEGGWAVGMAKKSVGDQGGVTITPEEGVWAVGREKGKYVGFVKGLEHNFSTTGQLKRIRVCLNSDLERVAFFDADAGTLLYAFSGVPFSGEPLCPYFAVYGRGRITLPPLDEQTLKESSV